MSSNDAKRSLEDIFVSTFHDKMSFEDFKNLDINNEFRPIVKRMRTIYAPSLKLKMIHRFINKTVLEFADYNTDVVYSYRKGVSIRDAVEKHSNNNYFFQTDFSNFYGSIKLSNVKLSLENQLSHIFVSDIEAYISRIIELTVVNDHIPVGFATSPLLSNICLFKFDTELLKYCIEHGLIYTRYSDDIIISGTNNKFTINIENVISELLNLHVNSDVEINKSKTKVHKKGHRFKILGFSILPNGIVTIPSNDKKDVELLLHFYLTDNGNFESYFKSLFNYKEQDLVDKPLREYAISALSGKLIAFNSMDKSYVSKLRRKYGNTVIDMFIRKLVK